MKLNTIDKIVGGYKSSLNDSKIITGYNNIKYMVGGNARYKTRSNVIDWNLVDKTNFGEAQIKVINEIMQFPEYLTDKKIIYEILVQITKLPNIDFLNLLEKSLNLNEGIIIQLRRLFYIIDKINKIDKIDKINKIYIRPTEFCQYEPVNRINILLNLPTNIMVSDLIEEQLKNLIININNLTNEKLEIKNQEETSEFIVIDKNTCEKNNLTCEKMTEFISRYTSTYDALYKIEKINIIISQELEKICNLF